MTHPLHKTLWIRMSLLLWKILLDRITVTLWKMTHSILNVHVHNPTWCIFSIWYVRRKNTIKSFVSRILYKMFSSTETFNPCSDCAMMMLKGCGFQIWDLIIHVVVEIFPAPSRHNVSFRSIKWHMMHLIITGYWGKFFWNWTVKT